MKDSESVLRQVGVSMSDLNGETRGVSDILEDLGSKWSRLSTEAQQSIAIQLVGREEYTRFIALMQNFPVSLMATESAMASQGVAMEANAQYMNSLEGRLGTMRAAWEALSLAFGSSIIKDVLTILVTLLTSTMHAVTYLVENFGALPTVLGLVVTAIALVNTGFRSLFINFATTTTTMLAVAPVATLTSAGLRAVAIASTIASAAINTLKFAIKGLMASTIIGVVFALLGTALEWIIGKMSDATQATEDLSNETDKLNQKQYELTSLKKLAEEYNNLANKATLSFEEKAKLSQIENELSTKYGINIQNLNGQTKSLDDNNRAIKNRIDLMEQEVAAQRKQAELTYASDASRIDRKIKNSQEALAKESEKLSLADEKHDKAVTNKDPIIFQGADIRQTIVESTASELKKRIADFKAAQEQLEQDVQPKVDALNAAFSNFLDMKELDGTEVEEKTRKFAEVFAILAAESGASIEEIKAKLPEVFDALQNADINSPEEAEKLLKRLPIITELTNEAYKKIPTLLAEINYSALSSNEETRKFTEEVNQTISDIGEINSLLDKLSQGQLLSADEMNKLIQKYPELSDNIVKLKNGYKIEETALLSLKNSKIAYFKTLDALGRQEIIQNKQALADKMRIWGIELDALQTLAKLQAAKATVSLNVANEITINDVTGKGIENQRIMNKFNKDKKILTDPYNELLDEIYQSELSFQTMLGSLDDVGLTANNSTNTATNKALKDTQNSTQRLNNTFTETTEILTKTQEKFLDLAAAIKKLQTERSTLMQGSQAYIDSLKQEKDLVEQQVSLANKGIANPSELVAKKFKTTKNGTATTGNTKSEVIPPTQKELSDAKKAKEEELSSWNAASYQLSIDIVEGYIAKSDREIAKQQNNTSQSAARQENYNQVSQQWRDEEASQISYLELERKAVEQQIKDIKQHVAEYKLTQGEFNQKLAENETKLLEIDNQQRDKHFRIIVSNLDEYEKKINAAGDALELSRAKLSMLDESSQEYQQELQKQIALIDEQRTATLKEIEAVQRQLNNERISAEHKEELTARLKDLTKRTLEYNDAIFTIKDNAADKIIENYKKLIEQQRDFALQAIEDQTKAENKRHEQRLKNIDEEHKAFENYIRNELEQLDRNAQSEDYESELKSKIDERQKLQDRFNKLLLDTSYEAKMKRQDLQAQMDTKDEEIAKFKEDRERELRKQGLNDQLQDRQDIVDQIKDTENDLNQSILDNIDSEKTQTERKYKDMLEDEQRFYQIKQNLMSEDNAVVKAQIEALKGEYATFFSFLKERAFETSQQFQNMMNSFQLDKTQLDNFQNLDSQIGIGSGNGSGSGAGNNAGSPKTDEAVKAAAWQDYLQNKRKAEDIRKKMAKLDKSSAAYKDLDKQFQALYKANEVHRKNHGFPDKSYDELKKLNLFSAEQGGVTGSGSSWQQGKFALLHEKEMVLNKADTGNILNAVGVARSIIDKLQALTPASIFKTVNQQSSSTSTDQSIAIDQVIIQANDKDSGSKLWRSFEAALNTKMKSRLV